MEREVGVSEINERVNGDKTVVLRPEEREIISIYVYDQSFNEHVLMGDKFKITIERINT